MLKKLGRDVAVYGGADFVFKLVSFLVIPVYTHLLSVAEFGTMALLTVSATLVGSLANLGINNAMHRFYFDPETAEADRHAIVSTGLAQLLLALTLVVGGGLLMLAGFRTTLAEDYGLAWAWIVLVALNIVPEQVAQYALDAVRLHFTPWKFFVIAFVKNVVGVVLGLILITRTELGLTAIFLGTLIASTLAMPVGLALIRRDLSTRLDRGMGRAMFRYGYPFVFTSAAYWIFGSMDRWLLAEWSSAEEVGLFSVALKFAALLTFVITAFTQAWSPFAMRMMREDPDYRAGYARIFSMWFFLLGWIGLGIALFSPEVMTVLTPREYWPAAPVLAIGTAGLVLFGTTQITALGISITKRTGVLTAGAWAAAAANLVFNLIAIPRFGAIGAAAATLLSYGVLTGWFGWWSQRLHPIPLDWPRLACGAVLVAAAALSPLVFPIAPPAVTTIAIKLALLALALGLGLASGILDRAALLRLIPARRLANG